MDKLQKILEQIDSKNTTSQSSLPEYKCEKCEDTGYISLKVDGYMFLKKCECGEIRRIKAMHEQSGISKAFQTKTFKSFEAKNETLAKMKNVAEKYLSEEGRSIAYLGQVGCGKTHLCTAICGELLNKGIPVIYMQYREAISTLKRCVMDEDNFNRESKKYKLAKVLYIDDLFKGKVTESDINIMFEIINHRYLNELPIIVSSEYTVDKLLSFDEAIGSRIIEMCKGYVVEVQGQGLNYRLGG